MTTRGIRRKKSYLVDAKIAVCGHKSVGKSGEKERIHDEIYDEKNKQIVLE
jgi:hypothetical protein